MTSTVLIIDDDSDIRALARVALAEGGLSVCEAHDGPSGIAAFIESRPDLILLDIGLGAMDGFEVCRRIRAESNCPIVFLTSRVDDLDQLVGFAAGADDYIGKPFSPRILTARVLAVLRREHRETLATAPLTLEVGPLHVDLGARIASAGQVELELTRTEFDLLVALMERPRQVLSREQLLESVWGSTFYDGHVVEVHMSRLRGKVLSAAGISIGVAVRSVGYRLGLG